MFYAVITNKRQEIINCKDGKGQEILHSTKGQVPVGKDHIAIKKFKDKASARKWFNNQLRNTAKDKNSATSKDNATERKVIASQTIKTKQPVTINSTTRISDVKIGNVQIENSQFVLKNNTTNIEKMVTDKKDAQLDLSASITVYTDGGAKHDETTNENCASWAYLIKTKSGLTIDNSGVFLDRDNHAMEVQAIVQALKKITSLGLQFQKIHIVTDSEFAISHFHKEKVSQKTIQKYPILETLYALQPLFESVTLSWCRGHDDTAGNNFVDARCTQLLKNMDVTGIRAAKKILNFIE